MKTIYFMRHSEVLKYENINNKDSLQLQNEKWPLTINGELLALEKSKNPELQNFDVVISSNYVRAISTAKYFAKDKILIDEGFGERKFGIDSWEELPERFALKQFENFDYKLDNGESLNEVIKREYVSLINILDKYSDKKVLIVGHSTAFTSLFTKWCEINSDSYKFKGRKFFDNKWNYLETFKLVFNEENNLTNIINLK